MRKTLLGVVGVAAIASVAYGQGSVKQYVGQGGPINDLSDQRFVIFVPDHTPTGGFSQLEILSLNINHTWVGDLYIEVRHKTPNDYTCVVLDRPGVPQSTFGNSDDLNGTYNFRDPPNGIPFPETASGGTVATGGDLAYAPHAGQVLTRPIPDKFGEWSLFISDRAGGDVGTLNQWIMQIRNVPAPGSLALLGLGGLIAGRRRR